MAVTSQLYYFTGDGNFGEWDKRSFIADVKDFSPRDWSEIDAATDMRRVDVAWEIYKNVKDRNLMDDNLYRMMLRKNFIVLGRDTLDALDNARRELIALLNDGWFFDVDFEIIEQVFPEQETYYDNVQKGESNE